MIWRLRMHKVRRAQERFFGFLRRVGLACGALLAVLFAFAGPLGYERLMDHGGVLVLLGLSLLLGGAGHALSGDAPSVREYVEEETEEMPGVTKLFSGLVASAGGVLMLMIGFVQLMG